MVNFIIQNATLLIALSFLYASIKWYKSDNDNVFKVASGVLFGLITIAAMMIPYENQPGIQYDGRTVIVALVGFWLGGFSVLIAAFIASLYRIFIGGEGLIPGLFIIISSGIIGIFFRHIFRKNLKEIKFYILYLIGFASNISLLASRILFPRHDNSTIIMHILIPVIVILPIAFAAVSNLFQIIDKYFINDRILKEAEELYRTTLLSIGDAVICTDRNGRINQINKIAETLTGWNFKEAKGKKIEEIFKIISEIDRKKVKNPVEEVFEKGSIVGLANHTLLITKQGNEIPIADSGAPIISNDEIIGVVLVFRDQTEERNKQKKLIESEAKYREREFWLSESQRVGKIGSYDYNILKDDWLISDVLNEILGYSKAEKHNFNSWIESVHPDQEKELLEYYEQVLKEKKKFEKEYKIIRKNDGAERWVLANGEFQLNKEGEPIRFYGTIRDITERKNFSLQLIESERAYRKLFEEHSAAKLLIDPATAEIVKANKAAADFYGWTIDELESMKVGDISIDSDESIKKEIKNIVLNERVQYEFKHRLKTGEIKDIEIFASKTDYKGRELLHSIVHDITDKRQLFNDLILAKESAEESERLKSAFLANMSHEIRTPLNGIVGFTNILAEDENLTKEKKQEFAQIISKSTSGLLKIINDILDISRLETGANMIESKSIDLEKMLLTVYNIFSNKLDEENSKSIKLELKKPDQSLSINSDESRLIQVFSNLIENAYKFTSEGVISFGVLKINKKNIEFFVSDTGIGIPKDKLKLIFDRFAQAEYGFTRKYGGTGLGLSIVKKLIELMGGEIRVESEINKGTQFIFSLPLKIAKNEQKEANGPDANGKKFGFNKGIKILVVEDDSVSRMYLESILETHFSKLYFAENGAQALQLYKNELPDIILMDIGLPDMNGLDIVRKIRETDKNVKIIAQTAYAMAEDKFKANEAGCNEYISKPVKSPVLLRMIKRFID